MDVIAQIITASFTAMFIENILFARALGSSTALIAVKNKQQFVGFSISITYICVFASIISYFIDKAFLKSEYSYLFMPVAYVLAVAVIYIITLMMLWKFLNKIFLAVKKYVHLSAFNCAVLGALFLNSRHSDTLFGYIGFGLGTGIGFIIASYFLSIVYDRLFSEDVPESFRGYPLILIYIGILSMAFYGFLGHQLAL